VHIIVGIESFRNQGAKVKNQKSKPWNLNAKRVAFKRRCLFPAGIAQCLLLRRQPADGFPEC
jgi:hypothetical protein